MDRERDAVAMHHLQAARPALLRFALALILWLGSATATSAQTSIPTLELPSNEWRQISVPGVLPAAMSSLEAVLGDDIPDAAYETDWAVYTFDNVAGAYRAVRLDEAIESGRGYWIIQASGASRTLDVPVGTATPDANDADVTVSTVPYRRLSLDGGDAETNWHMVGKPGLLATQVLDLRVAGSPTSDCPPDAPCSLPQAFEASLTDEILYTYDAAIVDYRPFEANAELPLWSGFWLGSRTSVGTDAPALLVPVAAPAADAFDNEFDGDTLSGWSLRHRVEGTEAQYTRLDVGRTISGALTIEPRQTPGWFANGDAPLIFKLVNRDFSVETDVLAESVASPGLPPTSDFNSVGLMARDPGGASGPENYVMVNVGRQDGRIAGGIGSETKTTVDSRSTLQLRAGSNRGRLTLCRVGDVITAYRWLDNESGWTEIARHSRPDLPATLQGRDDRERLSRSGPPG